MTQSTQQTGSLTQSGNQISIPNTMQVTAIAVAYTIFNSPATILLTVEGHMNDGTVDVLDSYNTVANTTRNLSGFARTYDFFVIRGTWTGGTAPGPLVNVALLSSGNPVTPPAVATIPLVIASNPPATATSQGAPGQITYDTGFIYICVALNTWKRVAVASF